MFLEIPFQGTGTIHGIIAALGDKLLCTVRKFNGKVPVGQAFIQISHTQIHNTADIFSGQRFEQDHLIQPVQELRTEVGPQVVHDRCLCLGPDPPLAVNSLQQVLGSNIGGEYNDRILKVHCPALGIRNTSVIQDLEQYIEYIRVGLLHLIKQHHAVWLAAYGLCQLAALVITHISWRCADQTRHGMLFHVFTHINTDHVGLVIKQCFRQCLGQFRLAYACGAQEQE